MTKHITRQQLNAYLDKSLTDAERRMIWLHVQECSGCYTKLQAEQALRADIRQMMPVPLRRDFSAMLPGILAEAQNPAPLGLNKTAFILMVLLAMAILLPLLPNLDLSRIAPQDSTILNVPMATHTLTLQERATYTYENDNRPDLTPESSSFAVPVQVSFNVEYASPAPLPRATGVASVEPPQ